MLKWFFIGLIYVLCYHVSFSQDLKFKRFSREEGLSSVNVKAIFQDSKDFIWIGTQDGLNRYDGFHFKVFKSNINDKTSLLSADINCITEDEDGTMYIGTNGSGLSGYDRITETFKNYTSEKNNICNNSINCLLNLNATELLIGTIDGLSIFNKKTKRAYKITSPTSTDRLYISALYKDSNGTIWVAIPKYGLYEFDNKAKKLLLHPFPNNILKNEKQYQDHAITSLAQGENHLYCTTFSGGIIKYNLQTKEFSDRLNFSKTDPNLNEMRGIITDKNKKHLWIATLGGLIRYDVQTFDYKITTRNDLDNNSITSNQILCLMQDKQYNIWLGSEVNGMCVNFKSSQNLIHYNKNQLKGSDDIHCFLETKNGLVWIGAEDGLYTFNRKTKEFKNQSHIIKKHNAASIWSLLEDKEGNIWIGTYNEGIILYNIKTKTSKKIYKNAYVLKLIQDSKNNIWAATYNSGIIKISFPDFSITNYNSKDGLSSDIINDVYENKKDNTYWLSTNGGGINILSIDSISGKLNIRNYNYQSGKNSISSNLAYSIYKDAKNTFWIATNNGLNKLNDNKFTVLTEDDGLPNNCIYSILPDEENILWLTTNNGLCKYDTKNNTFINYSPSNGIQAKEFNQGAAYKCQNGQLLVGGMNGFNYFNPKIIITNTFKPNIYLYSYTRQGKDIKTDTNIILKKQFNLNYQENYFTFELIALDYVAPEKIKFMYQLEGKDKDWSTPSSVRYISYTELAGGTYTLKIKATNSDGIWNETPYEITIKVIPPWYKTTWFYLTSFILIAGTLLGIYKYRTHAIKKENKILESKVAMRTKQLAEKNRDITSSIEYAKRIQEAILPSQELIFSNFKNAFILYKPKDIVSGDFYWFGEKGRYKIIAVVDCTGHGVPGAFMSMIGHNLLNQIVSEKGNSDPGIILQELHWGVQAALKQGNNTVSTNDGMDVSIIAIDMETNSCLWAGAFRNLIIIDQNGTFEKTEGNKYPIGGSQLDSERIFTTHHKSLQKNDTIYLFTDGYADQFGGDRGKKIMVKRFQETLLSIHELSAKEQHLHLENQFNNWKGDFEQVDDVLVIGIKI